MGTRSLSPNVRGIFWVGAGSLLFCVLNVFMLIPARHLNPYSMAFFRYFFGSMFLLPLVLHLGLRRAIATSRPGTHVVRGAIHSAGMVIWFVGLPLTKLADIAALGLAGPFFVLAGAALFLGERIDWRRWLAISAGLVGALIIIRPTGEAGWGPLYILAAVPIFAASDLIGKALARHDSTNTITLWLNVMIALCTAPFALLFWQTPGGADLLWLAATGLCSMLAHLCIQKGYQLADIALLQPIGFLSLLWNGLIGFALFGQRPDAWTFVGAAVICSTIFYVTRRELK